MTVMMGARKDLDYETPRDLFDQLNHEFHFTVDLAASPENALCPKYYSLENSAFGAAWTGESAYCNPPYGRGIRDWVEKACQDSKAPATKIVMLLPARTDTRWFHTSLETVNEIRFIMGRLVFSGGGGELNSAPFPSMLLVWDPTARYRHCRVGLYGWSSVTIR
jgi:phage N-6-adenine-methyltransferase